MELKAKNNKSIISKQDLTEKHPYLNFLISAHHIQAQKCRVICVSSAVMAQTVPAV
jgi:hypothetical protein